jgi:glutaminyl-peptide cyclotransferase
MKKSILILISLACLQYSCGTKELNKNNMQNDISNSKQAVVLTNEKPEYEIIKQITHDNDAYIQGLIFYNDFLYESTGHYGKSSIRKINPITGEILQKAVIPDSYFSEGITILNKKIYMLTWESRQCLVLNLETFKIEDVFAYRGEGWGLTDDGTNLIMSDGTNIIKFIDPVSRQVTKSIPVTMNGRAVSMLNELEYIGGKIWANIYGEDRIAVINSTNGVCERILELGELRNFERNNPAAEVLNGIAYNKKDSIFYITGKNWGNYFKMKIN